MMRYGLVLLAVCAVLVSASVPPTLPHDHPDGTHEQLHFSTVKEVIQSMERMWDNYTAIHIRNVELEKQIAVAEERLAVSSQLCNVEKRTLLQVQDLRVSGLERQLAAEKSAHVSTTSTDDDLSPGNFGRDGIHGGSSATRVCKCELAACEESRASVSELAQHILNRFEGIWMDEEMEKVPANEKAVLTRSSVVWAKDELAKKRQDGGQGGCNITDSATLRHVDQSDVTETQNLTQGSTTVEKENVSAPTSAGHTAVEKGSMYAFSEIQVSWHEAMSECKKFGLRLVSVQTADKGDLLHEAWQGAKRPYTEYWVSGRRMNSDDYVWEGVGETFTHTNWHAGHLEPRPHGHHCVVISFHGAHWLKLDCSQIRAFVCEP